MDVLERAIDASPSGGVTRLGSREHGNNRSAQVSSKSGVCCRTGDVAFVAVVGQRLHGAPG
jgi:hypothetical protein